MDNLNGHDTRDTIADNTTDRLTKRTSKGVVCGRYLELYKTGDIYPIANRLAEYEDLGAVAELAALKAENERLKDEMFFILRDEIDKQFGKGISTSELNFMTAQEIKHKIGKTKNYYKLREQRLEAESKLVKVTNPNATPYSQENQEKP